MTSFITHEDYENARTQCQGETLVQRPNISMVNGGNGHFDLKNCMMPNGIHTENHHSQAEQSKIRSSSLSFASQPPPLSSKDVAIKDGQQNYHHRHYHHHHKHKHRYNQQNGKVKKAQSDRFSRTAAVLRQAGLMKLTLQISQLIKTNEELQKEIDNLQKESLQFSENLKHQLQEKLEHVNGRVHKEGKM